MKKIILFFLCIVMCFSIVACGKQNSTQDEIPGASKEFNKNDYELVKVFFIREKDAHITLVSIKRWIKKDENLIEGALRELLLGPTKKEDKVGVKSEIPIGTRLIDIKELDNEVYVNLSNQYLTGGGAASVQMRYIQLFKTVKEVEPVKNIYLRIDGEELQYISGDGLELTHPMTKIEDYIKNYDNKKDIRP